MTPARLGVGKMRLMLPLILQLVATSAMFGIIWLVQLVHYPMFNGLSKDEFTFWHEFHSTRITFVVLPLMVAELGLSAWLAFASPDLRSVSVFGLTALVWISTFLLSVPLHNKLGALKDPSDLMRQDVVRSLVSTNWVRTACYSGKLLILIFWIV